MPDLLAPSFLICAVVACIAGMVRGFAGFGAARVMTPIFSALYGPAIGVALCLMLEIAVALPVVPGVVGLVDWRRIGLMLVAAAGGVVFVDLVAIATFASRGLVDWNTVVLALFLAPAVMLGGVLGARLFPLASESFYRRLALALLVGVAIGVLIL